LVIKDEAKDEGCKMVSGGVIEFKAEVSPLMPNSRAAIQERIAAGRIGWVAPVLLVVARSLLSLLAQGFATLVLAWLQYPNPTQAVISWWTVYGTLVDLGCLALLVWFLRREGIRLFDLVALDRQKLGKDVRLGIGIFAVVFPLMMLAGSSLASLLVYGKMQPDLPVGALIRTLPLWAVLYSRTVWWVAWSFTEELTYNGYALPRLQALGGRTWVAVVIVSFGWALQHSFLPYINLSHAAWLFIAFFPLTVAMQMIYLRVRRLPPLIFAHWAMDLTSVVFMVQVMGR
jgi:uncharacterized protein